MSATRRWSAWLVALLIALSATGDSFAAGAARGGSFKPVETRPFDIKPEPKLETPEQKAARLKQEEAAREQERRERAERETQREREEASDRLNWQEANAAVYSIYSGLKPKEVPLVRSLFATDPILSRLAIETFKFTEPPTLTDIGRFIALARQRAPGQVELGLFLDSASFGTAPKEMRDAWGRETRESPFPEMLDAYIAQMKGGTLIVVGHVVGKNFVVETAGRSFEYNIQSMQAKAQAAGVSMLVLGCNTAGAGAPAGYVSIVTTAKVVEFLSGLPKNQLFMADILAGMNKAGILHVHMRGLTDLMEVQVFEPGAEAPSMRMKISNEAELRDVSLNVPGSQQAISLSADLGSYQFESWVDDGVQAGLPWLERRATQESFDGLRAYFSSPVTWIISWMVFSFMATKAHAEVSGSRWVFAERRRQVVLGALSLAVVIAAALPIIAIAAFVLWFVVFLIWAAFNNFQIFAIFILLVSLGVLFEAISGDSKMKDGDS